MVLLGPAQKPEMRPRTKKQTSDWHSLGRSYPGQLLTASLDPLLKIRQFFEMSVIVVGLQFGHRNRVQRPQFGKPSKYQSHTDMKNRKN